MRYWLVVVSILICGCAKEPIYQSQGYVFGTLIDISIYGETDTKARDVSNKIMQDLQTMHNRFHAWQVNSEISNINQAIAEHKPIKIADDLAEMILNAKQLSKQSDGLFNPAIGHLIQLWGFQADEFVPVKVEKEAIFNLVKSHPSMDNIQINADLLTSNNDGVKLDLGGFAKGYALDVEAKYLREQNVKNALINIGGNIYALGKHGNKPWRVGIQHPRKPDAIATLELEDGWAIGTSGDYQRYFEIDGKRYCHIINPNTGYPADEMQAVTVLIPPAKIAGVLSDVASKPIFISEENNRITAAKKMGVSHYLYIDSVGKITISKSMANHINWLGNVEYKVVE